MKFILSISIVLQIIIHIFATIKYEGYEEC